MKSDDDESNQKQLVGRKTEINYKSKYKNEDIGMYFMDLSKSIKKENDNTIDVYLLSDYYFMLGCACQGRLDEVEYWYNEFLESQKDNEKFINHLNDIKPNLLRMCKIAKRIDDSDMRDLKVGESIGEYNNRKSLNSKVFMREYDYLRSLKPNDIL